MSTAINPLTSSPAPAAQSSVATTPATDPLASESTFLTLLVSQLKNQDPESPVDSNQFVTQLTQYSQLEQLIGIHKDTTGIDQAATGGTATATTAATPVATPVATPAATPVATTTGSTNQTTSNTGAN
jgi:flagellar basal-body rod modification protein FlgD